MTTEGPPRAAAPPAPPDVAPTRLLATLGFGGAIAGLLLVFAYGITLPTIEANKARELRLAVNEVLKAPARYDTLYVVNGALVETPPAGTDARKLEQLIFGYDPRTHQLLGMRVLESKETPGLGDKIEKDQRFIGQFAGVQTPIVGVKADKKSSPRDVVMITGATISSRAVIRIINNALQRLGPLVDAYSQEAR
jgi:electron transport complex protein RnfG